ASPVQIAFTLNMHGIGASMHHNWVVNSGSGPFSLGVRAEETQGTGLTHNYVSHMAGDGGQGGRYFSNVIRNYGLQTLLGSGIVNPIVAEGNYILGVEPGIQTSADCSGVHHCGSIGISYIKNVSNDNRTSTVALDNFVVSL